MSAARTHLVVTLADLNRRIAEAEMRSTTAADGLAALTRTEADTVEAERQLWKEMDTLQAMRRQLSELRFLSGARATLR
jgi:hypothetical protein